MSRGTLTYENCTGKKKAGNRDCPLTRLGNNTKQKNERNAAENNIECEMTKTKQSGSW
jgi:hypothetical protein